MGDECSRPNTRFIGRLEGRAYAFPLGILTRLKSDHCWIKRSRGFENPLPRTESPGLAQLD